MTSDAQVLTIPGTNMPMIGGDLASCDREPIHIPGSIQPHGCLLTLDRDSLIIQQISANLPDAIGIDQSQLLGGSIDLILEPPLVMALRESLDRQALERNPLQIGQCQSRTADRQRFNVIAHEYRRNVIVEFESANDKEAAAALNPFALIRDFSASLQQAPDLHWLSGLVSAEVRRLTGFDRVLVYQFDEEWNGTTIGESLDSDAYAPYMDLRFPASDIPRQARELYRLNRLRLIVDAGYKAVPLIPPISPIDNRPLDLSFASLRSVSPIHCEYLRNMNAMASMSISILRGGQLWGLIACHHRKPLKLSFEVRAACEFIGQVMSVQVEAREVATESQERVRLRSLQGRLLSAIADGLNVADGLLQNHQELLTFGGAHGAAIAINGHITLVGTTPTERQCHDLIDWLAANVDPPSDTRNDTLNDTWSTDALAAKYPASQEYVKIAAGVMAIRISKLHRSYVLWFRPEVTQDVKWGGDPRKITTYANGEERLHPRKSFEIWMETLRGHSLKWQPAQLEAAVELRNALVGIVLRKAEELAAVSAELKNSNRELEAFSYSVSHDLRAPFRHIIGYAELLKDAMGENLSGENSRYVATIIESARFAGELVDNLLSFSQMGRSALGIVAMDLNGVAADVRQELMQENPSPNIEWKFGPLPIVQADRMMIRLVVRNLLSNAVKYSRNNARPVVEFGTLPTEIGSDGIVRHVCYVRDNGVGFDMAYAHKLFGVFQRLHRMEDYEGTGIGLANVQRIVTRHGGRAWAEGKVGQGATFFFSLPVHSPIDSEIVGLKQVSDQKDTDRFSVSD